MHFRTVTAYGGDGTQLPDVDDVADWLDWTRSFAAVTGAHARAENPAHRQERQS